MKRPYGMHNIKLISVQCVYQFSLMKQMKTRDEKLALNNPDIT